MYEHHVLVPGPLARRGATAPPRDRGDLEIGGTSRSTAPPRPHLPHRHLNRIHVSAGQLSTAALRSLMGHDFHGLTCNFPD